MKTMIRVLVLVVIVVGIFLVMRGGKSTDNSAVQEENAVLLLDQSINADEYIVSYAKLARPGFVFIYAVDQSGKRSVVGRSRLLAAGEHVNVRIAKLQGAAGGGGTASSIYASIVADNGDGVYDEATDTEVIFDGTGVAEAAQYTFAESPEDTSPEDLAGLLGEAGYTVNENTPQTINELLPVPPPPVQATSTQPSNNPGSSGNTGPYIVVPMPRGNMMEVLPVP